MHEGRGVAGGKVGWEGLDAVHDVVNWRLGVIQLPRLVQFLERRISRGL